MKYNILNQLKCSACSGNTPKLSNQEILINISNVKDWRLNDKKDMIFKKFTFKSFKSALEFTNLVGVIVEKEGHHPDISIGWGYCLIMVHTHVIQALSINDFILAAKIDQISL